MHPPVQLLYANKQLDIIVLNLQDRKSRFKKLIKCSKFVQLMKWNTVCSKPKLSSTG
jgi:hypothetical protein